MPKFIRKIARAKNCPICASGTIVDYKDTNLLRHHLSERGKILTRTKTGICARHQRLVTKNIKRARVMALLPFVSS